MKLLNGQELADFIKERQAHQVRSLRQAHKVQPKLAIIRTNPEPVVDKYMALKQKYGADIQVDVSVHDVFLDDAQATIKRLNKDKSVHGIIVQLPLPDKSKTDEVVNTVAAGKDVDGLASTTNFDPATPMAINWLIAGYNINLADKKIVVIGNGRLVGKPLAKMWQNSDYDVTVLDETSKDLAKTTKQADVLVCATGQPNLIKADMVKPDAVIIDAGVATDSNGLVGDVADEVREMPDITITPKVGGVGPLTVCALFENVIRAASAN